MVLVCQRRFAVGGSQDGAVACRVFDGDDEWTVLMLSRFACVSPTWASNVLEMGGFANPSKTLFRFPVVSWQFPCVDALHFIGCAGLPVKAKTPLLVARHGISPTHGCLV